MPDEKLMRRLEKILALAERGVGGEKETATRMLQKLLDKHGMTYEDIGVDLQKDEHLKYGREPFSKLLMIQVALSVCGESRGIYTSKGLRCGIIVKLSPHEKIEIELKFNLYKASLKEQLELTFSAFIHKHNLFDCEASDDEDHEEEPELSPEESAKIKRMAAMMMVMPFVDINPALEKL